MAPERWRHIEELRRQALERAPEMRAAFLAEVCAGDDDLRRHLESLLAHRCRRPSSPERDSGRGEIYVRAFSGKLL